jgi:uncharacterized protein with von Willebrand factor type A (vWA) domain
VLASCSSSRDEHRQTRIEHHRSAAAKQFLVPSSNSESVQDIVADAGVPPRLDLQHPVDVELLRKRRQANRQIVMLTDGKPSALTERNGQIYKNPFGLDRRVVNKTLEEAEACRRHGIPITTFMLTEDPLLVDFVETFTRTNRGRAYYSRLDQLGSFVLVDYLRNRRRRV